MLLCGLKSMAKSSGRSAYEWDIFVSYLSALTTMGPWFLRSIPSGVSIA